MNMLAGILFDFDGVLCHDRFYSPKLELEHPDTYSWIQKNIFGSDGALVQEWMRGHLTSIEVNRYIAGQTGIAYETLHALFLESVKNMQLHKGMKRTATMLKRDGWNIGLITDNMDVFSEITIANHGLRNIFMPIINSADHGYLKYDEHGKLFAIAFEKAGWDIENTLLVDNSINAVDIYRQKGGPAYNYTDFDAFESFLGDLMHSRSI